MNIYIIQYLLRGSDVCRTEHLSARRHRLLLDWARSVVDATSNWKTPANRLRSKRVLRGAFSIPDFRRWEAGLILTYQVTIRSKLTQCGTLAFSGTPRDVDASSVPGTSLPQRRIQNITEELGGPLYIVRDYVNITQIITIGNGNVTGNTVNG